MTDRLDILREQLQDLIDYVRSTPQEDPRRDADWWAGPFPAFPEDYDPDTWILSGCKPLIVVAIDYNRELHHLARTEREQGTETGRRLLVHWWGLGKVFGKCGDLLAASEQAALEDPYWTSVVEEIRRGPDRLFLPSEGRYYTREGDDD